MNVKTEDEGLDIVKSIIIWCMDNNSNEFCCFSNFSGHVNLVTVKLISGGYSNGVSFYIKESALYYGKNISTTDGGIQGLKNALNEMKEFKAQHDINFSSENIAKTKDEKRLSDIAVLEEKIEKLKSVDQL